MPAPSKAVTLTDWQEVACADPAGAAREVLSRVKGRLSPAQQSAVFAALETEDTLEQLFRAGTSVRSPIAGVPYALKDLFYTRTLPLRAGSAFPVDVLPQRAEDGTLPSLLHSLGAVLLGKTNLHEFAYGLTGQNPFFGDCHHPRFPGRTTGGSSSGSAAAVAAGIVPFAIGTDTGGSIRVPAAFCGLHGLRLQPMDTFIHDAFPLAHRFDTAGWLVGDASDYLEVTRTLLGTPSPQEKEIRGAYVSMSQLGIAADKAFATAIDSAALELAPPAETDFAAEAALAFAGCAEAYAILQSTDAFTVHREWLDRYRASYSAEVWSRIDRGRNWSAQAREEAQAKMESVRSFWQRAFQQVDYVVLPATPFPALEHSACTLENRNRLLALNTPASLGGLPVRTVPVFLEDGQSGALQIVVGSSASPVLQLALSALGG